MIDRYKLLELKKTISKRNMETPSTLCAFFETGLSNTRSTRKPFNLVYTQLEKEYDRCPKHNVGDLNAQIGQEEMHKPTIGSFSVHQLTQTTTASC